MVPTFRQPETACWKEKLSLTALRQALKNATTMNSNFAMRNSVMMRTTKTKYAAGFPAALNVIMILTSFELLIRILTHLFARMSWSVELLCFRQIFVLQTLTFSWNIVIFSFCNLLISNVCIAQSVPELSESSDEELQMNLRPNFFSSVLWIQRCWADWQNVFCGAAFLCFCRVISFRILENLTLLFQTQLGARTTGWPYSVTNWSIIDAAFLSHSLFGFTGQVLYQVFSIQVLVKSDDRDGICEHTSRLQQNSDDIIPNCRDLHKILSNIDIKTIRPSSSSGSHCMLPKCFEFPIWHRESWKNYPHKFCLFTIDTIQILNEVVLSVPFNQFSSSQLRSLYLDYYFTDKVLNRRRRRLWPLFIRSACSDNGLIDLHAMSPYSIIFRQMISGSNFPRFFVRV